MAIKKSDVSKNIPVRNDLLIEFSNSDIAGLIEEEIDRIILEKYKDGQHIIISLLKSIDLDERLYQNEYDNIMISLIDEYTDVGWTVIKNENKDYELFLS